MGIGFILELLFFILEQTWELDSRVIHFSWEGVDMQTVIRGEVLYLGAGGWQAVLGKQRLAPFGVCVHQSFRSDEGPLLFPSSEAAEASSRMRLLNHRDLGVLRS